MASQVTPQTHLDREYLPIRAKILEIAAALDRIERAEQQDSDSLHWQQLQAGLKLLITEREERAERVQLLFSRTYDEQWRETFSLTR